MTKIPDVLQVSPAYKHYQKRIFGHGVISPESSQLKWYDITRGRQPIRSPIRELAQDFLSRQTKSIGIPSAQEMGFVLLHRCGQGFYFLGLCTWRQNNELWKTVFYLDTGKMEDFELFPQDGPHRDTFCIWELAVASHETLAWTRYLQSERTPQDADTYLKAII